MVELSAWMVGWWSACQLGWLDGARDVWLVWLVVEDGEAGREAVWVVELSAWMVRLVVRLSAWLVGWWSNCHLGLLTGVVAVWVVELSAWMARLAVRLSAWTDGWWSRMVKLVVRLSAWEGGRSG